MLSSERIEELADFLKTRRAKLRPSDVGLPSTARRRTPGLRREEVAELAGISSTWYSWLEQGRPIKVSIRTSHLIADALRLNESERSHFFSLLEQPLTTDIEPVESETVDYEIQSVMDGLVTHPAFALNHRWDILSWNSAAEFVMRFEKETVPTPNFIRYIFTSQYFKKISSNWETDVQGILAQFRVDYDRYVHEDPVVEQMVQLLRREKAEFRVWWKEHDVIQRTGWNKQIIHPQAGALNFKSLVFERNSAAFPRVVIYVPDQKSLKKLRTHITP